jgi:hypothetical protein
MWHSVPQKVKRVPSQSAPYERQQTINWRRSNGDYRKREPRNSMEFLVSRFLYSTMMAINSRNLVAQSFLIKRKKVLAVTDFLSEELKTCTIIIIVYCQIGLSISHKPRSKKRPLTSHHISKIRHKWYTLKSRVTFCTISFYKCFRTLYVPDKSTSSTFNISPTQCFSVTSYWKTFETLTHLHSTNQTKLRLINTWTARLPSALSLIKYWYCSVT